jgi:hypothetical protein
MKWLKQTGVCVALVWGAWANQVQAQAGDNVSGKEVWRAAYVVQSINAHALHPLTAQAHDCRARASVADAESAHWVVLRYRRVPGDVYLVAPVAPGLTLKHGQSVNVNVQGCQPVAQVRGSSTSSLG